MRFPLMLMFTTRLVVATENWSERRVHAFIRSIDHVSSWSRRICILELDESSGAKLHRFDDVFENWVTSAWCVFRAYGFSFRQLFSPFRSSFFFPLSLLHEQIEFFSGEEFFCRSFTPLATPRAHEIIARNVLSHCHGIIIAMLYTRPSFLARILQFKYSNVSCSYLCFPRFHIHLPSINHRPIPFIASSLYFSIFTFSSWVYILRFFSLLLLPAFVPSCLNRKRRGKEGRRKKKSRIPGQRFQGSVTSLTNWLPRIQPSLPRSCCSTDRAAILRRFAYPSRLVEKRHQESSLESA